MDDSYKTGFNFLEIRFYKKGDFAEIDIGKTFEEALKEISELKE